MMRSVMISGWASSSASWKPLVNHLADGDFSFIDWPKEVGDGKAFSNDDQVDGLSGDLLLFGWSLGAIGAMDYARRHLDRVKGMVLLAPTASFIARDHWPEGMALSVFERFCQRFFDKTLKPDYAHFARLMAMGTMSPNHWADHWLSMEAGHQKQSIKSLMAGLDFLRNQDVSHYLSDLTMPILLMAGEGDCLVSHAASHRLLNHFSRAQWAKIGGGGHMPHLVFPADCARIITQWRQNIGL